MKPKASLKASVSLLKFIFQQGAYFSLPASVFKAISDVKPETVDYGPVDPMAELLEMTTMAVPEFDFASFEPLQEHIFFRVVNPKPENRTVVNVPHMWELRSTIIVAKCSVAASSGEQWTLQEQVSDQVFPPGKYNIE